MPITEILEAQRILPVIGLPGAEYAKDTASAMLEGGMRAVEFTARFDGWEEAVNGVRKDYPELCVGVGTVLDVGMAERAIDSGVEFIVSPGFSREVLDATKARGVIYIPGCATATELTVVYNAGIRLAKFFPAESLGGPAAIKLLSGAFKGMRFLPTGGLDFSLIGGYLALDSVIAVGGSFMCPSASVKKRDRGGIVRLCRKALEAVDG